MLQNDRLAKLCRKPMSHLSHLRFFLPILIPLLFSACSTTSVPGLDRILFPESTAQVGPLMDAEPETNLTSSSQESSSTTEPEPPVSESLGLEQPNDQGTVITEVTPESRPNLEGAATEEKGNDVSEKPDQKPSADLTASQSATVTPASLPPASLSRAPNQPSTETVSEILSPEPSTVTPQNISYGALSGRVLLMGDKNKPLPATGTFITLKPKDWDSSSNSQSTDSHIIDMEGKEYLPRFSSINTGDKVVFVNKDNIRHNVFSSSGNNAFDLGTYGAGLSRTVTLKEPGIVKIYCNIHADMATFVAVGDPGLSAATDDEGNYLIENLTPGTYSLSVWNIRGEGTRIIKIKANQTLKLEDRIDTTAFTVETHKNKFGGNYSKNATLFEDEFY